MRELRALSGGWAVRDLCGPLRRWPVRDLRGPPRSRVVGNGQPIITGLRGFDASGLGRRRAGAHLIGQRRDAQLETFAGVALALPVERLMLSELLEQDRGQEVRPGKAPRRDPGQ